MTTLATQTRAELLTRIQAQQRADDIRTFREELARLEAGRIVTLTAEQRSALTGHHDALLGELAGAFDIDRDRHTKRLSLGMRLASLLGALALAASVFFLFRQYWGLLPTALQIGVLLAGSFGALLATFTIGRRDASGYFAKLCAMVSFTCFVLNVVLLGKMFNVAPSDNVLIAWAAFALLLAYAFDLRLLLGIGVSCVVAFVAARTATWSGSYWTDFGERPESFFPAAILLFAVPLWISQCRFAGFAAIYRVLGLLTALLPILVLANWGRVSYLPFDAATIEHCYQLLGFAVSAGAIWLGARREWPDVVNTGLTFCVVFLYTKLYDWWWDLVPKFVFFLILALTSILFLLVMRRLRTARLLGGGR